METPGKGAGKGAGYSPGTVPLTAAADAPPSESLDDWIVADPDSVLSSSAAQLVGASASAEEMLGVDAALAKMLRVEAALAYPKLPTKTCKLDAVLSVLAPVAEGVARAPLRLVAVLDKSGSMQGEKLQLVIETV